MTHFWLILSLLALGAGISIGLMLFTIFISNRLVSKKTSDNTHSDVMSMYMDMRNQRDSLLISLELANTTAKATAFANEKALAMMHELLTEQKS